jgi:hypothetical protein
MLSKLKKADAWGHSIRPVSGVQAPLRFRSNRLCHRETLDTRYADSQNEAAWNRWVTYLRFNHDEPA